MAKNVDKVQGSTTACTAVDILWIRLYYVSKITSLFKMSCQLNTLSHRINL